MKNDWKHYSEILEPPKDLGPGVARVPAEILLPGEHHIDGMDISSVSVHGRNVVVQLVVTDEVKKNMGWQTPTGTRYYSKHELVTVTYT